MEQTSIIEILKEIVEHNQRELRRSDGDQNTAKNLITLNYKRMGIFDPFNDETRRYSIQNPISYYGLEPILGMIIEYRKLKIKEGNNSNYKHRY